MIRSLHQSFVEPLRSLDALDCPIANPLLFKSIREHSVYEGYTTAEMQKSTSLPNLYNLPATLEVEFEWDYLGSDPELNKIGYNTCCEHYNDEAPCRPYLELVNPCEFKPIGNRKMTKAQGFYSDVKESVDLMVKRMIAGGYSLTEGDLAALLELERTLQKPSVEYEDLKLHCEAPDDTTYNVSTQNRFTVIYQDESRDSWSPRPKSGSPRPRPAPAISFTPRKAERTFYRKRYRTVRVDQGLVPEMIWFYTSVNCPTPGVVAYARGRPLEGTYYESSDSDTWSSYTDSSCDSDSEDVIPNMAPPKSPVAGCSFWQDDLAFGELNAEDLQQESIWRQGADMVCMVKNHITTTLHSAITSFLPPYADYIPLIASFVSSIISCLTSIVVFATQTPGAWVKAVLSVNIISSLTAFISSIAGMLKTSDLSFDALKATESIPNIASEISDALIMKADDVIPNALDPLMWIRIGITTIVAVMFAGLGFTKFVPWRDLASFTSMAEGGKKLADTVTNISKFVMEEALGLQFDHDHPACKELENLTEEGAKLISLQPASYIQNPQSLVKLRQFLPKIVAATTRKIDKDSSQRYNTIRQLLVTQYKSLLELEKTINAILVTKPKQGTIAVVLSGAAGVGKSELAKYLSNQLCDKLKYQRGIYCLNKRSDGFYEPYGGQRCAIYNEWMALRSEDPLIKDFNLIFSTDPMNFEGAALDAKVQPNQLAVGFLTANTDKPDLGRVLNEGAAAAVWDRTLHIRVIDPKCRGRQHANLHRKPDFSHLTYQLVVHSGNMGAHVTYHNISFAQLTSLITGRVCSAELLFNRDILEDIQDQSIKKELEVRNQLLSTELTISSPYTESVIPNALGREFFSIRLQGLPGCGKSSAAEYIALTLSGLFSLPIQISSCEREFEPMKDQPCIYILDDWVEGPVCQQFLEKMNATHSRSIYILCSNTVYKRYTNYKNPLWSAQRAFSKFIGIWPLDEWDATSNSLPDGVLRRIGLQGTIRLKDGQQFITPEQYTKTYTFGEHFLLRNKYGHITNREKIIAEQFSAYINYMDRPTDFIIVEGKPPITHNSPVTIRCKDQYTLIKCLRSTTEIVSAYTGKHPDVQLKVDYMDLTSAGNAQTMVSAWRVYEDPSTDKSVMRSVFSRMCATFGRLYPTKSFFVECTAENIVYYYYKGIGYIYNPKETRQESNVTFNNKFAIIDRGTSVVTVDVPSFVGAKYFCEFKNSMKDLTYAEAHEMYRQYDLNDTSDGYAVAFRAEVQKEYFRLKRQHSPQALWLKTNITEHPVFWLGVGLLAMIATGGAVYGLVKLVKYLISSSQKDITADVVNSGSDDSQGANPKAQSQIKRLSAGGRFKPNSGYDDSSGDNPKAARLIKRLTGNSVKPNSKGVFQQYNNQIHDDIVANMLTDGETERQPPSMLEYFSRSIRKSYCLVQEGCNTTYGLFLKNNIFITVAHIFEKEGMKHKISSNGKEYSAEVIKIWRDRDLAVCRVLDKKFPSHPNIRKSLIETDNVGQTLHGFFIRPGEKMECMSGIMSYYYTTAYPITASTNNRYNLKEKFLVFTTIGLTNLSTFIKPGDCGFPLVTLNEKNELKIVGIHNAYNHSEKSYFSGVNVATFDEVMSIAEQVVPNFGEPQMEVVELPYCELTGVLPTRYCDILDNLREERNFQNYSDKISILGYSRELHYKSNPVGKHKLVDLEDMQTPVSKLPGAYTMDYVEDTSKLAKSVFGKPAPLFSQCIKYDVNVKTSLDDELFHYAVDLAVQDAKIRYPGCRVLRKHEVINGLYDAPLQPLDLSTSPGPYVKLVYKLHNKQTIFKEAEMVGSGNKTLVFDMESPVGLEVSQHFIFYMDSILNHNLPPIIISKDCPKVENIDEEKARAGKVRLFNEIDLSINMVLKAFFGDLLSKIIRDCNVNPIRLGQDPFLTSTAIMRQFNEIDGEVISTDFRAFDKTLPKELIYAFCHIAAQVTRIPGKSQSEIDDIFRNIAHVLIYVIHTCNGTVYMVDRGNESGTFVTTMLNSFSVWIMTLYTVIRKWRDLHGYLPTLSEVLAEIRVAILGDDRSFKCSKLIPITVEDFVEDSLRFGTECSPAKTETKDGIDFCSRSITWDSVKQIAWPALKLSSIYAQLHWFATLTVDQILVNLDNAMMEASLHREREIFDMVFDDALLVVKHFGIGVENLAFHSRDILRRRFYALVIGDKEFDSISLHVERNTSIESEYDLQRIKSDKRRLIIDYSSDTEQIISKINLPIETEHLSTKEKRLVILALNELTTTMSGRNTDPVSAVVQFCQKVKLNCTPEESYDKVGPDHNPHFICNLQFATHHVAGEGKNKKEAKREAYRALYDLIVPVDVLPNMFACYKREIDQIANEFMQHSIVIQLDYAKSISHELQREVVVLAQEKPDDLEVKLIGKVRYGKSRKEGMIFCLSDSSQSVGYDEMKSIYLKYPNTTNRGAVITVGAVDTVPNSGQVGAQEIQGTMKNPGLSTIPHLPNPISTHMMPAMAANEPAVVGAMEPGLPVTDLNPIGPSNMLGAGAVQFCLTDMLYSQYLDSDVQYTFTDTTQDGAIIFQIPYDPLSSF